MPLALCCASKKAAIFFFISNIYQFPHAQRNENSMKSLFENVKMNRNYGKYCKWFRILFFLLYFIFIGQYSFYDWLSRIGKMRKLTERCDASVEFLFILFFFFLKNPFRSVCEGHLRAMELNCSAVLSPEVFLW